ncbi:MULTISPECIES: hypothetical protein [unclassified Streptomyces]|uniref:hypothetical protein n=1 Tax=unclassified Streptomyces TaxID=2593676 RepID=UPI000CD56374|nr:MULTISPECIES: hypothetical protein [unclassified Streptomyces]
MTQPYVTGERHPACGICPARLLPFGAFDVAERPSRAFPFSPADGHRYTDEGVPVCVHPDKVGVPAAQYRTAGATLATPVLELPDDVARVDTYLREALHGAAPSVLDELVARVFAELPVKYPGIDVTATMRRALC